MTKPKLRLLVLFTGATALAALFLSQQFGGKHREDSEFLELPGTGIKLGSADGQLAPAGQISAPAENHREESQTDSAAQRTAPFSLVASDGLELSAEKKLSSEAQSAANDRHEKQGPGELPLMADEPAGAPSNGSRHPYFPSGSAFGGSGGFGGGFARSGGGGGNFAGGGGAGSGLVSGLDSSPVGSSSNTGTHLDEILLFDLPTGPLGLGSDPVTDFVVNTPDAPVPVVGLSGASGAEGNPFGFNPPAKNQSGETTTFSLGQTTLDENGSTGGTDNLLQGQHQVPDHTNTGMLCMGTLILLAGLHRRLA
jgi:hypothetical protein